MGDEDTVKAIEFFREDPDGAVLCHVYVYDDDSAYIAGRDVELVIEFTPDAEERAIAHVESLGYKRTKHD